MQRSYLFRHSLLAIFCSLQLFCLPSLLLFDTGQSGMAWAEELSEVDFDRDIRPILSDNCYHCHGPDENTRKANLKLHTKAGMFADLGGYYPIVPGKPADSELYLRVSETDPDLIMPPPKSKLSLTKKEVELIKRWIAAGAPWSEHWAFQPPTKPTIPKVKQTTWPKNEIDHFILKRLEAEGLAPSKAATREKLIRRVTLDLTGLPPTPDEVWAFLADQSPNAYEKVVDRLFASQQYGERMAWEWLDAARYADTDGFQGDPTRTMWPWRDWLVNALNNNMPFDQFTREMLAGDLIPNHTTSQLLASGFNRNHMNNGEGGRIAEETRIENVFDRAETTSTVWLGLTMTCARCHDHKYDPISQAEYYQLFAFFNNTSESGKRAGGKGPPVLKWLTPKQEQRLKELETEIAGVQQKLSQPVSNLEAAQAKWEQEYQNRPPSGWEILPPQKLTSTGGSTLETLDDLSFRAGGKNPEHDTYEIFSETRRTNITALRLQALLDEKQPAKNVGRDIKGNFVLSELELFVRPLDQPAGEWQPIKFSKATADHSQGGFPVSNAIDGKTDARNGWAVDGHIKQENRTAIFHLEKPTGFPAGTAVKLRLQFVSQHAFHNLARGRFSITEKIPKADPKAEDTDAVVKVLLAIPSTKRTGPQSAQLRKLYRENYHPETKKLKAELTKLQTEQKTIREKQSVSVMVMDTLPENQRRTTFVLERGTYNKPTEKQVTAATPDFLPSLLNEQKQKDQGKENAEIPNRLQLADWLMRDDHPLTARVTVNRYWQTFFGQGLVKTTEDFGSQGEKPSHPELLDWLAMQFIDSSWDVKAIHKLMVMSATYQQSSRITPELLEKDGDNILLARAPRYRLPSWMLRDQALAASGLLSKKMGGPSVKPYQPEGIWADATFGKIRYTQDKGEALYRRSLYIFWRRIVGPTMFFDSGKRQTCEVKPLRTNTPLHALVTLNDITFVEAARAMAERVLTEKNTTGEQIAHAFELATAREPNKKEREILSARLDKFQKEFAANPENAKLILGVGDSPRNEKLNLTQHAAFTSLCSLIMNLDEVLTKE